MDDIQASGPIQLFKAGSLAQVRYQVGTLSLSKNMQRADQIHAITESTNSSSDAGDPLDNKAKGSNVGAIAGGVVGGSVGALAVAASIWYFLSRRQSRPTTQKEAWNQKEYVKPELHSEPALNRASERHELDLSSIGNDTAVPRPRECELP
jgi:hypothetical protein